MLVVLQLENELKLDNVEKGKKIFCLELCPVLHCGKGGKHKTRLNLHGVFG